MNAINSIKAIIILQFDGKRTLAKYYDAQLQAKSKEFEKNIYSKMKTSKSKDDLLSLDENLILHKFVTDAHIYVVGGRNEHPVVLNSLLECIVEIITSMQSNVIGGNVVLENLSRIMLALDEICDSGMILETKPKNVLQRISDSGQEESLGLTARRLFGL